MVPGCDKAYKNPNGLKYHNVHGHQALAQQLGVFDDGLGNRGKRMKMTPPGSPGSREVASGAAELDEEHRPFKCTIPGCAKAYKNINGLRYHLDHAHPHGALHVPSGRKQRARWEWERRAEWIKKELEQRLIALNNSTTTPADSTAASPRHVEFPVGVREHGVDAYAMITAPHTPVNGSLSPVLGSTTPSLGF